MQTERKGMGGSDQMKIAKIILAFLCLYAIPFFVCHVLPTSVSRILCSGGKCICDSDDHSLLLVLLFFLYVACGRFVLDNKNIDVKMERFQLIVFFILLFGLFALIYLYSSILNLYVPYYYRWWLYFRFDMADDRMIGVNRLKLSVYRSHIQR